VGHIPLRSDLFVYSIKAVKTATFSTSDNVPCDQNDKEKREYGRQGPSAIENYSKKLTGERSERLDGYRSGVLEYLPKQSVSQHRC
jgi:hypothetical protein